MSPAQNAVQQITERLERRERELQAARRISEALFQRQQVDDLVEQALLTAIDVVQAEAGCVLLADQESKQLVFYHSVGEMAPPSGTAFPWDQGIAGSVFQSGEAVVVRDVKRDSRHFTTIDAATGYMTRDMIALPLKRWEGEPVGVLEVMNKRDGHFDEDDTAILSIISGFTTLSIQQARLFEESKLAEVVHVLDNISQDVKNLLIPVDCGASLLQSEVDDHFGRLPNLDLGKARASHKLWNEVLQIVRDNSQRVQDHVKQMVDCVRGLSTPLKFAPCQVASVVNNVMQTLDFLAKDKNVTLRTEALEDLPTVLADERRLFNAFYSLVNNAIAEVPAGGSITVRGRVDPASGGLLLAVADTGRETPGGLSESLSSARGKGPKASGADLGAKIVKDVVDAHGGEITVDSDVGGGTTFHIRLPLYPPSSTPR